MLYKLSSLSFSSFSVILFQHHLCVRTVIIPLPSLISFTWKYFKYLYEIWFFLLVCAIHFLLDWTNRELLEVYNQDRQNTYNFTRTQPIFGLPGVSGWSLKSSENFSAPSAVHTALTQFPSCFKICVFGYSCVFTEFKCVQVRGCVYTATTRLSILKTL